MRRFLIVVCGLTLIALPVLAGGKSEGAVPENHIRANMEGWFGGEGTPEAIIDQHRNTLEDADLSAYERAFNEWRIRHIETLAEVTTELGITWEGVDWGWGEPLIQRQLNAFLADRGPDVLVGETQMPGYAQHGYLLPFPDDLAEKVRAEVVPGAYGPMEVDGKIYGLTFAPGVSVLFWNKDLLRRAGLDPDRAPETWDEWLEMVEQITEAGNGEFYGGGTYAGPNFGGALRVGPFMMMAGGGFINDEGYADFTNPGNVKALSFIRELARHSPEGLVAGVGEGGWWDAFNQERIAYVVDGPWRLVAGQELGIDIGYSVLPVPEGGRPANVTIGAVFYGVPVFAENPDAAFKFIEAQFDRRVQDLIRDRGDRSPGILVAYRDDPEFLESYIGTFYESLWGDVSGLPTFTGERNARIWDVFQQHLVEAIVTDGDIEQILGRAQALAARYERE